MAVPVTLAGPCALLDDGQFDAEQGQPRRPRQPLAGLTAARGVEGTRISAAGLRGHGGKVDLLHSAGHHKLRPTDVVRSIRCLAMLIDTAFLYFIPDTRKGRVCVTTANCFHASSAGLDGFGNLDRKNRIAAVAWRGYGAARLEIWSWS